MQYNVPPPSGLLHVLPLLELGFERDPPPLRRLPLPQGEEPPLGRPPEARADRQAGAAAQDGRAAGPDPEGEGKVFVELIRVSLE